jgi:pantoate--beta-alanine ligase
MEIVRITETMQRLAEEIRNGGQRIGLVPTMGFLHEGHLSLIRTLRPQSDVLVVSIFVNPTQFGPGEDLNKYPRDIDRDEQLCRKENVDIIFYPNSGEMYPEPYLTYINVDVLAETMCGKSRPGHFRGVATVVSKLFNIIKPHTAIFGQKDYQQSLVIRQMVRDLNFDINIITAPIVREHDGLALSSRNKYLDREERKNAPLIYKSLQEAQKMVKNGITSPSIISRQIEHVLRKIPYIKIDYIAIVNRQNLQPVEQIDGNTLIALAVYVGKTRLIDNVLIEISPH